MDWQGGISVFGLGFALVMWVVTMIWPTLPRRLILCLLFLGLALMLVWPVSLIFDLFHLPKPANEPATYIEVTDIIYRLDLFEIEPANTIKVDVNFKNKGPLHAKDVTFGFVLAIRLPSITKTQEYEMFYELLKNRKGSPKADMGVGVSGWKTIVTSMLNKKETDDFQNKTTRLYSLGFIHYRDKNGQQTHEFCRWLDPPNVWHLCDGGHNQMVSGDTPY